MPRLLEAPWLTKATLVLILCEPSAPKHNAHGPILVKASARPKALLVSMVCKTSAPIITSMSLDFGGTLAHEGLDGADVVPTRRPQQHKARAEAGLGIRAHQGNVGVDGVRDRCSQMHKHVRRLLEAPW